MERHLIEKISAILKEEIKNRIKKIKETTHQDAEIYDLLGRYIPYIDKDEGHDHDIEIKRGTETLDIHFRVEKQPYLISIVIY